jgi:hypothetical protein
MYTKKTTLYAKIESTSGTDSTPTAAANAIMAYDVDLSIKADMKERYPGNADRSAYAEVRGKTVYELKFRIDLKGSGTAGTAPRWGCLLKACDSLETIAGGPSSVTYTPALTSTTCTIWVNIDGILHKLVGCAGEAELVLDAGTIPAINFTFQGVYSGLPTDAAVEAMTYDSTVPVIVKGTTTTLGLYAGIIEKFGMKTGNTIAERTSMNAADGVLSFIVTERKPTWSMIFEMVLMATSSANMLSYFHSGTAKALSFVLGATAGNITTITAPACIIRAPKIGDREGLRTWELEGQLARSSGNDEWSIKLT